MAAVGGRDQLRRDTDPVARPPHAALEDVGHSQDFGDLADIRVLSLEGERRRARDDFQPRHLDQRVDDLLAQPVAEVLVVGIAAHVGEGKHGDRSLVGRQVRPFQRRAQVGHRREPFLARLAQATLHDADQLWRCFERTGLVAQDAAEDLGHRRARERAATRQQLVEHGPETEDVGPLVEGLSLRLLG